MPKEVLARNLAFLMQLRGWKQVETAKRAGVDQKVISYVLNQKKTPGLDVVDKIAAAFGLNLWHMIMPTLPEDLTSPTSIREVYEDFFRSDPAGREHIAQVAHREAEYNKNHG
jgi:transcriptional regulator with XRE-family HTH domain